MYEIIIVSGFGASPKYTEPLAKYLQYYTQCIVHNFSLIHGVKFEIEVDKIVDFINKKTNKPIILIGFSTGCNIVIGVSHIINVKRLILINPAELLTRLPYEIVRVATYDTDPSHIKLYKPFIKKSSLTTLSWSIILSNAFVTLNLLSFILGKERMAEIYYACQGKWVNEPRPDELVRLAFTKKSNELFNTIRYCLLSQNTNELIRNTSSPIHIFVGMKDSYIHLSRHIFNNFDNNNNKITINKLIGDHHTLYHFPKENARTISDYICRI